MSKQLFVETSLGVNHRPHQLVPVEPQGTETG